ncbi:MAG: hypothetical protein JW734_08550 [Candidatus Omnitrophica bacterium]|nr:hypothetical protein [Candidatus Omnitrophota bacterium]
MKQRLYDMPILNAVLLLRNIVFVFVLYFIQYNFVINYHNYIGQWLERHFVYDFYKLRIENPIINYIVDRLILIMDGKIYSLIKPLFLIILPLLIIYLINCFLGYFAPKAFKKTFFLCSRFLIIGSLLFLFSRFYLLLSINHTLVIAFILMFVYLYDLVIFEYRDSFLDRPATQARIKTVFLFLPVVAELLFLPLYLMLVGLVKGGGKNRLFSLIKYGHFSFMYFFIFLITMPLKVTGLENIVTTHLVENSCSYGLTMDEEYSRLFLFVGGSNMISMNLEKNRLFSERVYPLKADKRDISEVLAISQTRKEIYIIDRGDRDLVIVDFNGYSIKGKVYSEGFSYGDSRVEYGLGFVYVINDDDFFLYKIDPAVPEIKSQVEFKKMTGVLKQNKIKDVLYTADWHDLDAVKKRVKPSYFIYEIDTSTLGVRRIIEVSSGCWDMAVSEDGKKLFCALPFAGPFRSYVYVIDADSFRVIDKIKVPLGTRAIALDDERGLLFAGSAATNLVEIIDFDTKKVLKTYRAGPFSLRAIAVDKKRRDFYVSTMHFGVLKGEY